MQAHITLIPEEGKDLTSCQKYRPISLLNVDLKLFYKILASHLALKLTTLIHYDQVGFIPTREAKDSVTRVLDLIHAAESRLIPPYDPVPGRREGF